MNPLFSLLLETSTRSALNPRLRIGIVLSGRSTPAWVVNCVREAASLPFVDLECLFLPARRPVKEKLVYRALLKFARRRYDVQRPAALEDGGIEITCKEDGSLSDTSAALIRQRRFDVLFAPQPGTLAGNCQGLARYGVWSVALDDRLMYSPEREYFRWATSGAKTFSVRLTVHRETWEDGRVFLHHMFPGEPGMWFTHNGRALEGLGTVFALQLLAVHWKGADAFCADEQGIDCSTKTPDGGSPGTASVLSFVAIKALRSALLKLPGRDGGPGLWFIVYTSSSGSELPTAGRDPTIHLHRFSGIAGHEAADPFPAAQDGRQYIFFEDIPPLSRKGRLAVKEITESGDAPVKVIMEAPGHLSYPCVFQHSGEWYMIPESGYARTVDLLRSDGFPLEWTKVTTLARGPTLVDTTPLWHEGAWYFFTTAELDGGWKVNLLFVSEELTGQWCSHPCNPLSIDAAACRSAGHVVRHQGRMIRLVQDCTLNYGYAIVFSEILELTPSSFRERRIGRLDPDWQPGLRATHTWNRSGGIEVLDGRS